VGKKLELKIEDKFDNPCGTAVCPKNFGLMGRAGQFFRAKSEVIALFQPIIIVT
jgi:hypothetical protein